MFDFYDLNARHTAIFLWIVVFLAFCVVKSPTRIWKSVLGVLTALSEPMVLSVIIGLMSVVLVGVVATEVLKWVVGVSEPIPVVATTFWFFTSGFSLFLNIGKFYEGGTVFLRKAGEVLGPAAAVTALVDFSILPLWWELFLFPAVTGLFLISKLGYSLGVSREDARPVVVIAKALLIVYLVALIWLAAKGVFQNPNAWEALVQTFWVPAFLTVGALPYLKLVMVGDKIQFDLSASRKAVRSGDYGSSWPLTVNSATLCCKFRAVWVEVDRKKYGLNGTSKAMLPRYGHACFDLEEIWREHPDGRGKVNIGPLIRDGLALKQPG